MAIVKHPVSLVAVFTWLGLVAGIAFIASGLKHNAFGVSLPVGLGLDQVMFRAMHRAEWVLACAVLADLLPGRAPAPVLAAAAVPVLLLALQTAWLQPALQLDALPAFHGQGAPGPGLRTANLVIELAKCAALAVLGILHFQRSTAGAGVSAPHQPNTRS